MSSINQARSASGKPPINSLAEIKGFRERYISYILENTRIEQEGQVSRPGDISQKGGLLAAAGFNQPGTSAILATGPGMTPAANVSQHFANPDAPSRSEMEALAQKVRAAGYTGPIPSKWYTDPPPGLIAVPVANGLIDSMTLGATDPWYDPQPIRKRHGLL